MSKTKITTFRIARIAIFACLLFIQEEVLSFLPNVQLTQCLIAVYFFAFGFTDTFIIILIHVLLDNLIVGSFSLIYTPTMFIAWISLLLLLFIFRKWNNKWLVSIIVFVHAFIYSYIFILADYIYLSVDIIPHIVADITFELILALTGFVSTLLLLNPLVNILKKLDIKKAKE